MKLPLYWKVQAEIQDAVSTDDGFTGRIMGMEKGKIKVKYDAPLYILKKFGKKSFGWYQFKELSKI